MSVYLHDIPLDKAQARLKQAMVNAGLWHVLEAEIIPLNENAVGRVLGRPVWAKISSPHYHASAMDGYAVKSSSTIGAMPTHPISMTIGDQAVYVDTGDPLPVWAEAVIPIENIEPIDAHGELSANARQPYAIRIREAVPPWRNVRPLGEDIVATQLVLPAGHVLRPVDLGAIAACGHYEVAVVRKPRVAIIPTGTELVAIGNPVEPGDIIEYNSIVLAAQVNSWGGIAQRYDIVPDDFDRIRQTVAQSSTQTNLILLNAGSSAGSEDYSAGVVEALGELLVHGVAVRPGHPVILGMIEIAEANRQGGIEKTPLIGVPGYPVSAALTGEIFVKPLIERWLGILSHEPQHVQAKMTRKVVSPAGDVDYLRVAVGKVGDQVLAAPLPRGAGVISSLVQADGIVILPAGSQGVPAGEQVSVRLYRSLDEIERTILAIGSHDISLDILAQFLANEGSRLASANVGSLGGLLALKRGEAHLAGSHLLDIESGEYNLSYIRQYLPELSVVVIKLVGRQQGLIVATNNPKHIISLADLNRKDIKFINRQRGAGTRVLLDYQLQKLGIDAETVNGYEREEYTHLAIAAAIASERADCGLGIAAAARALGLDFVPLYQERYDLVIPARYYESELLLPLQRIIHQKEFQEQVAALPGYDVSGMGEVVARLP
jgi:putative molybdopterin biosynthesis protein